MSDDRLFQQLDRMEARLDSVDVRLAEYNKQLDYHIVRTDELQEQMKPVQAHVEQVKGAGKLILLLSTLATIAGGIAWIWSK